MKAEQISAVCFAMLEYYAGDPKRIQHFLKVHAFAKLIAEKEREGLISVSGFIK